MDYFIELNKLFSKVEAYTAKGGQISLAQAIAEIVNLIIRQSKKKNKVILIGNGGSASIASHISTDLLKNAQIGALAFNDPSLITCLGNDLGYEYVFQKPIEMLAKEGDILLAISSSGQSKNILKGVEAAQQNGCIVITLSGFSPENPLRSRGELNLYVPSNSYGYVESVHSVICHCIVDTLVKEKNGPA